MGMAEWWHWILTDWRWAIALVLLLVFGVVAIVVDSDGDWWII